MLKQVHSLYEPPGAIPAVFAFGVFRMAYYLLGAWGIWCAVNVGMMLYCAFCIKPNMPCFNGFRIVMPTWLSQVLTDDELRAVEAHERGHRHHLHIWRNLLSRLFFVPPSDAQRFWQEIEADDYAAKEGRSLSLAVALRKLSQHPDDILRSDRLLQRMGI
ncbi:M48 family metalloprotease [Undibacterium sp. TJN19]|uniref:M48 family metalloprotease n=1 Tax=Undibacterium sp. TJN19 TaxID=3413055 RepID=UPI003BF1D140